jgi:hypothetical protein
MHGLPGWSRPATAEGRLLWAVIRAKLGQTFRVCRASCAPGPRGLRAGDLFLAASACRLDHGGDVLIMVVCGWTAAAGGWVHIVRGAR